MATINQTFAGASAKNNTTNNIKSGGSQVTPFNPTKKKEPIDASNNPSTDNSSVKLDNGGVNNSDVDGQVSKATDRQTSASNDLISSQQDALKDVRDREEKLSEGKDFNQQQEEDAQYYKDAEENTKEFYGKNEDIIKQTNEDISKIEEEQIYSYQDRIDRDAVLLNEKKESETALLRAQSEKQRVENENAIRQAKIDVDIQRQQSAWGYNKIGLGFSSGIINQSQQIATNGIVKIAELKASMNFQEATITAQIAEVEYNYANLINSSIDKYTDKIDELKKGAIARANDIEKNLLLNNFNKKTELEKIAKEARDEKRLAEKEHIADIEKARDKAIEYQRDIQASIDAHNTREQAKLNEGLSNGTIVNMLPGEIANKEAELGLPAGTINSKINQNINGRLTQVMDGLAGSGYMAGDLLLLNKEVRNEMSNGRTYNEAIDIVINREKANNPKFKKAIDDYNYAQGAEARQEEREFKLEEEYKLGNLRVDQEKAKTDRMKVIADINKDMAEANANNENAYYFDGISETGNELLNTPNGTDLTSTGREQCGAYFNDITGRKFPMGDSMEDKLNVANIKNVEVGDGVGRGVVWDAGNSVNGHVGVVLGEDEGGFWVKSSNIKNDGKISTDYIERDKIQGYTEKTFNPQVSDKVTQYGDYIASYPHGKNQLTEKEFKAMDEPSRREVIAEAKETSLIDKFKKGNISSSEFGGVFKEEISYLATDDRKENKKAFEGIFSELRKRGVDDEVIISYLVEEGLVTEQRKTGNPIFNLSDYDLGDRELYIEDGKIYRSDAFRDTLIYTINEE